MALAGFAAPVAKAQQVDTLRLMQYNLCNYGNPVFSCPRVNRIGWKDSAMRVIFSEHTPDMVGFNEVNKNTAYTDRLRDQVLNAGTYQDWASATPTNTANSDLINAFFFRTSRVGMKSQSVIPSPVRDINHYRMYVQPLPGQVDTIFFNVIQAHLKAGNAGTSVATSDTVARWRMVKAVNRYLATLDTSEGVIIQGDFNFYRATEAANKCLVRRDSAGFFVDPLRRQGRWSGSASFADVHTQSPHGESTSDGCHSIGGIDDRFDFQYTTAGFLNSTHAIAYLPSAFRILGNDGNHFNRDVTFQPNTSVSPTVAVALRQSDHLPIMGKLTYRIAVAVRSRLSPAAERAWLAGRDLHVQGLRGAATATLYAVTGAELGSVVVSGDGAVTLPASVPAEGVVVLRVYPLDGASAPASFRLLVTRQP